MKLQTSSAFAINKMDVLFLGELCWELRRKSSVFRCLRWFFLDFLAINRFQAKSWKVNEHGFPLLYLQTFAFSTKPRIFKLFSLTRLS